MPITHHAKWVNHVSQEINFAIHVSQKIKMVNHASRKYLFAPLMYAIEYGNADDNTRNDKFCQLGPARLHVHEFANICHFLHSYRR